MISALLLIAYAIAAGTLGARSLLHARWTSSAPRLAITAWQAVAASILMSLLAAGAALSISFRHVRGDLARLFELCADNLKHGYASPGGAFVATLGVTAAALLVTRTAWCAARVVYQERRERAARLAVLDLVGRAGVVPGALVLDHDVPYAFCIGGRRRRVVVTEGLVAALNPQELEAVLAHESAHLHQRHHLALMLSRTLFGTLAPFFPGFGRAMSQVRLLAELCADDSARRQVGARPLGTALARLACMPAPTATLAASAHEVEARLLRLSGPDLGLGRERVIVGGLAVAAVVMVPLALVAAPAIALAWEGICLIG